MMPVISLRVRATALAVAAALLHAHRPALAADPIPAAAGATPPAGMPGTPASPPTGPSAATSPVTATDTTGQLAPIEVTSSRLRDARIDLSPSVGTTVYTLDSKSFESLSEGTDSSFDEVLLHLPGVSKDSKASGVLHIRDDHGNLQYRIDGVQLPESISGFGTAMDTRFVDHVDFLTGALPAQYGLHTAGVIEIQTKEGKITPGGEISLQGGSQATFHPSAQFFGSSGDVSWYVSASALSTDQGIENPQPTRGAIHDNSEQARVFGNFSWFVNEDTRAALLFGSYSGTYQIPDNPGQLPLWSLNGISNAATGSSSFPSSALNERQSEENRFIAVSLEQTFDKLNYQLSVFHQTSGLHFTPDPVGDLVFTGAAGDLLRSSSSNGLQLDAAWKALADHTVRFGGAYTANLTGTLNNVAVFPTTATGIQTRTGPVQVDDGSSLLGTETSVYLQDEWRLDPRLTLNYGVRYDRVNAYIDEDQWSPRFNLAWKWTPETLLHAGFSRYFTPPPQELAAQRSISLFANTSNAPLVGFTDNVRAERTSYFDLGVARTVTPELTIAVDAYLKEIDNLLDEGQFGQAIILSPFNYAHGTARGVELGITYSHKPWSAYGNLAWQKAQAHDIISGQDLFAPAELAYIATHDVYLDHDQTWTASTGGAWHLGDWQLSGDALFGTGLRKTDPGGPPNGDHLASYGVFNLGLSREWKLPGGDSVEGRLSALNLFDRIYELRDGTGVGVGAPQYGLRRSAFASASWRF